MLSLAAGPAAALTGGDGFIAITTSSGIEVFDSSGDGSDIHVLIPGDSAGPEPAWSPTGTHIAFEREPNQVWVARSDGTGAHRVSPLGENAFAPAWSPDGRIVYYRDTSTVVIIDADGGNRTVVDHPGAGISARPAWTADGRLVLLLTGPELPARGPYIADGDGTNFKLLTTPGGNTPVYSDLSDNWQFSPTGLVAYVVFVPGDQDWWVTFTTFDGTHIGESWVTLDARSDVALSPSGQRAVRIWQKFHTDPDEAGIGVTGVDLTQPDPFIPEFGFNVPGDVAGVDWQPRCSATGTPGDDQLTGTPGPDLMCGLGGDDVISGKGGNDVIYAGPGQDTVFGGTGNDVVVGGRNADRIRTGSGRDLINSRRDALAGDSIRAGDGHDVCLLDRADKITSCRATS